MLVRTESPTFQFRAMMKFERSRAIGLVRKLPSITQHNDSHKRKEIDEGHVRNNRFKQCIYHRSRDLA